MTHQIGTLREGPLHAALKSWVAQPGARFEVDVEGWVVDVVQAGTLVEVQTGGFSPLRPKLDALLDAHPIRIVTPLPYRSLLTKVDDDGVIVDERWSPKRATRLSIFERLVSFPTLLDHPNLTIDLVGITQREVRRHQEGLARRRRGWFVHERHLMEVVERVELTGPGDLLDLLPEGLREPFTTADLAALARVPRRVAQQTAYCLRELGSLVAAGTEGRAVRYAVATTGPAPGGPQISPSPRTAVRSSSSSATEASMSAREASSISSPWTTDHSPSAVVHGNDETSPSGTP